jgi:hypothetical protein
VANDGELLHRGGEHGGHLLLVSGERLPEASGPSIASEGKVGLQTELSNHVAAGLGKWGSNFTRDVGHSRETGSLKQGLNEELSVKLEI